MLKRFAIAITLLLPAKIWALSCSSPLTLSNPDFDAFDATICATEQGDAAVLWEIRDQKERETIAAAYKTKNSTWSSPNTILEWSDYISFKQSFINSNGNIRAVYRGDYKSPYQSAEKKLGESWTHPLDMFISESFDDVAFTFDSLGNIICAVEQTIKTTIPPVYSWDHSREKSTPALAITVWAQDPTNQDREIFSDESDYTILDKLIISNQSGMAYVFWISKHSNGEVLRGRKIQNGQLSAGTEIISQEILPTFGYGRKFGGSINEKGNVALSWIDQNGNLAIVTNFDDIWSEPLILPTTEKNPYKSQISIDADGNIMAVYQGEIDDLACVVAVYKPFGQPWMDPVQFSDPDRINQYPRIQSDLKGNFVLIWEKEIRNRHALFGATFSTTEQKWSSSELLSPKDQSCSDGTFVFWSPGKGYITWMTTNGFELIVQVAELSN